MKLRAIDPDPGAEALPVIAHDLELQADGQQLAWVSVTYFYCEFFHISFLRIILKWSRVRVENYPYHLTHTLVRRLTRDPTLLRRIHWIPAQGRL